MQTCTLAVDIGASSGRHIAGTVQNGKITLQEVYRFENGVHRENGHLCWDIDTLAKEVVNGLKAARRRLCPRDHRHRHLGRRFCAAGCGQ